MNVRGPEQWYIVDSAVADGTLRSGPFDADQLRREILSGRFPGDNLVMRGRTGEAISVAAMVAFIGALQFSPVVPAGASSQAMPLSSVGRTVPDEPPVRPLALRPLLIGASAALILSVAIPRVAGASAGVHFGWEDIATDPAGVLCAPVGGLLVLLITLFVRAKPRLRGIVAVLAGGVGPAVLGVWDRRLGWTEALVLCGTIGFAVCVFLARVRWAPLALKLAPLVGSLAVAAAYLIPTAGRMPLSYILDLLQGRSVAIAGHAGLTSALLLAPLAAAILAGAFIAVAAIRRVALSALPAHVVLSALPLTLAGLGVVMLLDQRPEWVVWWQMAAQVAGALYLASAGAASAIARPADLL